MSRSEAKTKRRKVWVNFYGIDGPPFAHPSYREAERAHSALTAGESEAAVRFVEARPGDVVLSRDDVADCVRLADVDPSDAPAMRLALAVIRRTLRGGR